MKWAAHIPHQGLAERFVRGASKHGDVVRVIPYEEHLAHHDYDGLIMVGISGIRHLFDMYRRAGKPVLCVDKGYIRGHGYLRVTVNDTQPTAYLNRVQRPLDRLKQIEVYLESQINIKRYDEGYRVILFDGASQKLCDWYGLGFQQDFAVRAIEQLKRHVRGRKIVYRPRAPDGNTLPIFGTELSLGSFQDDLKRAHVVVSYSGAVGWNAIVGGIPHFAFGPSVARSMSETDWRNVGTPKPVTEPERRNWMANVAYCQWNEAELMTGAAWPYIMEQVKLA